MCDIGEDHKVTSPSLLDPPPRRATGKDEAAAEQSRISWSELDNAVALAISQSIKER